MNAKNSDFGTFAQDVLLGLSFQSKNSDFLPNISYDAKGDKPLPTNQWHCPNTT